jgi:hypothetical protein
MEFYLPDSLSQDFDDILNVLGKNCTLNYSSSTPVVLKALITDLKLKNKTDNNDNNMEICTSMSTPIKKGDYLTNSDDGNLFLITWTASKKINCYKTIGQLCTAKIDFKRWQSEVIDNITGDLITSAQYVSVVDNVDCSLEKKGNFIFNTTANSPGIVPQSQMVIMMQANPDTLKIKIGDEYLYRGIGFQIEDIDYSQVDINDHGLLILFGNKREGGWRVTI